ncbi:unnamed protein product [Pleuronectes platessa]|uniref:Uncharacterized protein n=1 Tax=Pleuronectes platessa TaxID=8262 RepID=A0A9N7TMS4_PLEPL|nr:unnamed protein product [Pleuronectes platessa]
MRRGRRGAIFGRCNVLGRPSGLNQSDLVPSRASHRVPQLKPQNLWNFGVVSETGFTSASLNQPGPPRRSRRDVTREPTCSLTVTAVSQVSAAREEEEEAWKEGGKEGEREGTLCMTIPTSVCRFVLCHIRACLCGRALSW